MSCGQTEIETQHLDLDAIIISVKQMVKKNSIIEVKKRHTGFLPAWRERLANKKTVSDDVFVYFAGRGKKNIRMAEHITVGLQELSPVVPVDDALIGNKLAVDILVVHDLTVTVDLVSVPLGAECNERGQRTEVIDMVVYGTDAEGTHIRNNHGAVEGAGIEQGLRNPPEVIHYPKNPNGKTDQETGKTGKKVGNVFGSVVLF